MPGGGVQRSFLVAEILFVGTGILITVATLLWMNERRSVPTTESVARLLLLQEFPFPALLGNGVMIFVAALLALPSFAISTSRGWLKVHGWLVVGCACMTLILGLNEWIQTLQARANLSEVWASHSTQHQSLLQQKFDCCGYTNFTSPPYVPDTVCTNDLIAASKSGCETPFADYAEDWLNLVFTAAFGIVGLDVVLLLCIAMVIKRRKELLRYRRIDEKRGLASI